MTCSATFGAPPGEGNVVVAMFAINQSSSSTVTSVADDSGATYNAAVTGIIAPTGFGLTAIYYRTVTMSGTPLTVTVTASQSTFIDLVLVELAGVAGTTPMARQTSCMNACGDVDLGPLPSGAVSLAAFTTNNTGVAAISIASGWLELANHPTSDIAVMGGGALIDMPPSNAHWQLGAPQPWVAVAATFPAP